MHYGFSGRCRSTPVCLQRNSLNYGIWLLTSASKKHLVWHSGLSDAPRQSVSRVLNDLSVPLYDSIGTGGVIDYDTASVRYGGLAGWAMTGAAAEMAAYGPASQWLLLEGEDDAWLCRSETPFLQSGMIIS